MRRTSEKRSLIAEKKAVPTTQDHLRPAVYTPVLQYVSVTFLRVILTVAQSCLPNGFNFGMADGLLFR